MMQPLSSSLRGSQRERQRQLQRPQQPQHHQQQQQQQHPRHYGSQHHYSQQQQQQQQQYHPHVVATTKASAANPAADDTLASTATTTTHTMISDIAANLGNESLTDFTLVAKDGTRIPAARFVLGARSPVFRNLLFGSGKDARSDMILCGYSGTVVRALVDFCSKDEFPTFRQTLESTSSSSSTPFVSSSSAAEDEQPHPPPQDDEELPPPKEYQVRQIVHLYDCARYYQLQGMEVRVCELASDFLQQSKNKYLACALFDEASTHPAANRIKRIALLAIRSDPQTSLLALPPQDIPQSSQLQDDDNDDDDDDYDSQQSDDTSEMTMFGPHGERQYNSHRKSSSSSPKSSPVVPPPPPPPGVSFLSKLTLYEILKDSKMSCEEIVLFQAILQWTETSPPEEDYSRYGGGGGGSDVTHATFNSTLLQGGTSVRPPSKGPSKFTKVAGHHHSSSSHHPQQQQPPPPPQYRSSPSPPKKPIDLDRCELAKEYVKDYIDLTKMGPSDLVGIVTESGLVPQDTIWNAMSDIALQMEKGGAPLSKVRYEGGTGGPKPTNTNTTVPHEINVEGSHRGGAGGSSSNSIQTDTSFRAGADATPNHNALRRGRSNTPRSETTNGKNPTLNHYDHHQPPQQQQQHYPTTLAGQFTAGACGGGGSMMDHPRNSSLTRHQSSHSPTRPHPAGLLSLVERFGTMCTTPDFRDVPSMSTLRQPHHTYPPPSSSSPEAHPQEQRGYYSNNAPSNPHESPYR
eukprot:CAMPEP_0195306716 /NCGR_PEP_ID=MMETSP0707-20130614/37342_1 /TAXON_ID=33640 /ORGANISM="Asterionellopsis glacialis, Strain CCMP134" /LENGTH=743 /DNA_ID=CAMNT_0040370941 /DNA_START=160 /DNA_END=2391 /DNA_ORIENTATION=+